jgi:hypothetical protein
MAEYLSPRMGVGQVYLYPICCVTIILTNTRLTIDSFSAAVAPRSSIVLELKTSRGWSRPVRTNFGQEQFEFDMSTMEEKVQFDMSTEEEELRQQESHRSLIRLSSAMTI